MKGLLYRVTYPCEKIREFMYDHLEESLPTLISMRFHLHLNGCLACREYLFLYKKAANTKEFRKENPIPQDGLDRTLDFLRKEGIVRLE